MTLGLGNKKHVGTGNSTTLNETIHEVWLDPGATCAHASSLRNVSLDAGRVARALSVFVALLYVASKE